MKKICAGILAAVVVLFCFTGCGKRDDTNVYTVAVYMEENGITQDRVSTANFKQFNAIDTIIFHYNNQIVRILEFKTPEDAQSTNYGEYTDKITINGRFILDSTDEKVIEVFKGFDAK